VIEFEFLATYSGVTETSCRFEYCCSYINSITMSILTPKKAGELVSKLAKNVLILPDGIKKLAYEVRSARK
jgi:hypothetical protein